MSDPATPPPSTPTTPTTPYAPANASGQVAGPASILLKIAAGLGIFLALMQLLKAVLPASIVGGMLIGGLMSCVNFLSLLVIIAAMVVYLVWQYRAYEQVRSAGASTTYTPGWSVGWWIIPFANLVFSRPILDDLWRASEATASPAPTSNIEQSAGSRPQFVWFCFIGTFILIVLAFFLAIIGIWSGVIGRLGSLVMAGAYLVWAMFFFGLSLYTEDVQRAMPTGSSASPAPAPPPAGAAPTTPPPPAG